MGRTKSKEEIGMNWYELKSARKQGTAYLGSSNLSLDFTLINSIRLSKCYKC